jgi:hypothetical protein
MSLPINSLLTTIKVLDISGNTNLRSITSFTTNCTNLTTIKANDCNIYFLHKNILDLIDLNDINLDNNPKLSFNNFATSKVLYTPEDMEYLLTLSQQEKDEHLIYDDSFKSNRKFSIFFRYLTDYIIAKRPLFEVVAVANNNNEFGQVLIGKNANKKNNKNQTYKNRNRTSNSGKLRTSKRLTNGNRTNKSNNSGQSTGYNSSPENNTSNLENERWAAGIK